MKRFEAAEIDIGLEFLLKRSTESCSSGSYYFIYESSASSSYCKSSYSAWKVPSLFLFLSEWISFRATSSNLQILVKPSVSSLFSELLWSFYNY